MGIEGTSLVPFSLLTAMSPSEGWPSKGTAGSELPQAVFLLWGIFWESPAESDLGGTGRVFHANSAPFISTFRPPQQKLICLLLTCFQRQGAHYLTRQSPPLTLLYSYTPQHRDDGLRLLGQAVRSVSHVVLLSP